jgi:hypothetical protein
VNYLRYSRSPLPDGRGDLTVEAPVYIDSGFAIKVSGVPPIGRIWGYAMEIGAVPGIGALSILRARVMELDPPAIFTIDGSAKPGDRAAQRVGRKAAGAEEDSEDVPMIEGERGEDEEEAGRNVDTFA